MTGGSFTDPESRVTETLLERFNQVFLTHDPAALQDRVAESIIARGDRGEIRWRLVFGPEPANSVRGVNLMRIHRGRIVEAQGYVKGP